MNAYRVTILFLDHENFGVEAVRGLIRNKLEHVRVIDTQTEGIGDWHDKHPFNFPGSVQFEAYYDMKFGKPIYVKEDLLDLFKGSDTSELEEKLAAAEERSDGRQAQLELACKDRDLLSRALGAAVEERDTLKERIAILEAAAENTDETMRSLTGERDAALQDLSDVMSPDDVLPVENRNLRSGLLEIGKLLADSQTECISLRAMLGRAKLKEQRDITAAEHAEALSVVVGRASFNANECAAVRVGWNKILQEFNELQTRMGDRHLELSRELTVMRLIQEDDYRLVKEIAAHIFNAHLDKKFESIHGDDPTIWLVKGGDGEITDAAATSLPDDHTFSNLLEFVFGVTTKGRAEYAIPSDD